MTGAESLDALQDSERSLQRENPNSQEEDAAINSTTDPPRRPDTSDDDSGYVKVTEILQVPAELPNVTAEIKKQRKFVRLATRDTEYMFHSTLLNLSLCYEPRTVIQPAVDDIIIGVSENPDDFPILTHNQRRLSHVLVCMPHAATFSRPLQVNCTLLHCPDPNSTIKVFHSATDVTEQSDWRESQDVQHLVYDRRIELSVRHFCLYCVVEECTKIFQKKSMITFLYLR